MMRIKGKKKFKIKTLKSNKVKANPFLIFTFYFLL